MKHFAKSKTIWGAVVTMLPTILPLLGLSAAEGQMISVAGDALIQAAGAILAIYGRLKAKDQITL